MANIFITDFTTQEVKQGGAEQVDEIVINKFDLNVIRSNKIVRFYKEDFYIISNISLMPRHIVDDLKNYNYIILEHDYKICETRHPWRYPNNIIPEDHRMHYDLYRNAKAVFVQTTDHLNVFLKNGVDANFVNLKSSLWAKKDLDALNIIYETRKPIHDHGIYQSGNWIKNTDGAINWCKSRHLNYQLIGNFNNREDFLSAMSACHKLVFFPLARESFCRLVVEAKCMGMDVITSDNYGAVLEDWYSKYSSKELIDFLYYNTQINLGIIDDYLQ